MSTLFVRTIDIGMNENDVSISGTLRFAIGYLTSKNRPVDVVAEALIVEDEVADC